MSSFRRTKTKQPLRETQMKVLAPIYDKVQLLRQHMEDNKPPINIFTSQEFHPNRTGECFLELAIDRNQNIAEMRKLHCSQ